MPYDAGSLTIEKSINNGNISQSYSQCVERISGIKDIFDFKVPDEVARARETKWDDFFERHSKEPSDDIDLNVDILEPEEEEEEEEESEEDHSFEKRLPVRTSSGLVQYWINTGNLPPCKTLDENALSESASSLSEKEETYLSVKNADDKQESKTDSTCSSVDTAVYILSNANVTKKADTMAIIAGVEKNLKSAEIGSVETMKNSRSACIESVANRVVRSVKDIDISNNDFHSLSATIAPTMLRDNVDVTDNVDLQSKETPSPRNTDKVDTPSQKSARTDGLASSKVLQKDSLCKQQALINVTNEGDNTTPLSHRKKLYTGRNSPIDLLQTKVRNTNRLSNITDVMHPALSPNAIVKKNVSKCKSKPLSLLNEHFLKSEASQRLIEPTKKKIRRKRSSVKINASGRVMSGNKTRDSATDSSSPKYPSELRNRQTQSQGRNDTRNKASKPDLTSESCDGRDRARNSQERDDADISANENEASEPDRLTSVNLNPVVVLTRIRSCNSSKSRVGNNAQERNIVRNNGRSGKLHVREIENLDEETTIGSDDNTVILICECKMSASPSTLFSDNCSGNLRVSRKNVTEQKAALKKTHFSDLRDKCATSDRELRELGVVLERLSPSVLKNYRKSTERAKSLKVSCDATEGRQKEALRNRKLPEVRVVLERLPANAHQKSSYDIAEKNMTNLSIWRDNERNGRENQNKRRNYSTSISSSDESSGSESTRPPEKRSKVSINARKMSGEANDVEKTSRVKAFVFDSGEKNTKTYRRRVRFSVNESNNNNLDEMNGKRFFFRNTDASDDASCLDATERSETRCKNDVGIVLFQTKTYETDSSDSEIYYNTSIRRRLVRRVWTDSSSLNSSGKEEHDATSGTRDISSRSATSEENSHDTDTDITDRNRIQSTSLLKETSHASHKKGDLVTVLGEKGQHNRFKKTKSGQESSVKSTTAKSLLFQTKTYYDSDSSE